MIDLCIRCGTAPATPGDWLHCEPCFQDVCNEVEQARSDLDDADNEHAIGTLDAIGKLMDAEGLSFMDAVERLYREQTQ